LAETQKELFIEVPIDPGHLTEYIAVQTQGNVIHMTSVGKHAQKFNYELLSPENARNLGAALTTAADTL
jgi:predicted RNase H-like nuclease (RuvC/YqgF family)